MKQPVSPPEFELMTTTSFDAWAAQADTAELAWYANAIKSNAYRLKGTILAYVVQSTAKGTGYAVGDTFTVDGGRWLARGRVVTVTAGAVETVFFDDQGAGYTTGVGVTTTTTSGGGDGAMCIDISTVTT